MIERLDQILQPNENKAILDEKWKKKEREKEKEREEMKVSIF
jgi:hypothetical protein